MNFRTLVIVISAFTLGVAGLASLQVLTVRAYVPTIASIDYYESRSIEWLNITMFHPPPPALSSGHYISLIQVEVNGTVVELPQTPQVQIILLCSIVLDRPVIIMRFEPVLCAIFTGLVHGLARWQFRNTPFQLQFYS